MALHKVVVITGGSSGIGRSTAALFAHHGWRIGLIARGRQGLEESARDIAATGSLVATAQADVSDSIALSDAVLSITNQLGPVDVWVNCAGNGVYGRFGDVPETDFHRITEVTYHGTVNGTRIALAHMRERGQGTIINICSAAAFHGLPLMSSYSGAKAAVRAFGQAVRGELKLENSPIRLRSIFPPAVNTPFFSHAISHMGWPARPVGPVYQPQVIAQGIWLAAKQGNSDTVVSGTAALFSLACRISPTLIGWCMGRLKFERQTTHSESAYACLEPTVHAASTQSLGTRGPFGALARNWSAHLWLKARLSAPADVIAHRGSPLSAPALQSKPDPQAPHQERADLALQSSDS